MAKRTSNSSVNSSIRQQTKSNEEGLSQVLEAQQASLGELTAIRQLLELSKEHDKQQKNANAGVDITASLAKIQENLLDNAKEHLKGSRRYWKTQEEFEKEWRVEAKNIAEMAQGMKTFKTMGDKFKDKVEGVKEKFQPSNLKETLLKSLNVGGIFDKKLAQDEFVKKQKALGSTASTKELKQDFEGAQSAAKETKKNEKKIAALKKLTGIDDEEKLRQMSPEGSKLIDKRQSLADDYAKYDRAADVHSPTPVNRGILNPLAAVKDMGTPKSPTATAAEAAQGQEVAQEGAKMEEDQLHLLKIIADNTGGKDKAKQTKPDEKKPDGGGLLDSIFGMLSTGLMTAFKALLNPGAILKALGKVFAIGMIVGALFEGIMDGFKEFQESGDIGKALIAGLAGIIDFLTFGLFDKEKIKEVIGDFAAWTNDHIIKPVTEFFTSIKDGFMNLLGKIKIPAITIPLPKVLGGDKTIGPWSPFGDSPSEGKKPEAAAPTTNGNVVDQKSADNAAAASKPVEGNKTNVVNAPVTNNSNTTQVIKSPIRNQESSQSRYLGSRYAT